MLGELLFNQYAGGDVIEVSVVPCGLAGDVIVRGFSLTQRILEYSLCQRKPSHNHIPGEATRHHTHLNHITAGLNHHSQILNLSEREIMYFQHYFKQINLRIRFAALQKTREDVSGFSKTPRLARNGSSRLYLQDMMSGVATHDVIMCKTAMEGKLLATSYSDSCKGASIAQSIKDDAAEAPRGTKKPILWTVIKELYSMLPDTRRMSTHSSESVSSFTAGDLQPSGRSKHSLTRQVLGRSDHPFFGHDRALTCFLTNSIYQHSIRRLSEHFAFLHPSLRYFCYLVSVSKTQGLFLSCLIDIDQARVLPISNITKTTHTGKCPGPKRGVWGLPHLRNTL
eukprot:sb/3466465/